jgi:hypothetical protein
LNSSEGRGGCPLGSLAGQLAETDAQARALIAAGFGQWSAAISDGLRRIHDTGHQLNGTDPDDLAITLLAALQGGLLLAQVQRDTRSLQTAVDTILGLARITRQNAPADGEIPHAPLIPQAHVHPPARLRCSALGVARQLVAKGCARQRLPTRTHAE